MSNPTTQKLFDLVGKRSSILIRTTVVYGAFVKDFKKDPDFIARQRAKELLYEETIEKVKATVQNLFAQKQQVWSIAQVQQHCSRTLFG